MVLTIPGPRGPVSCSDQGLDGQFQFVYSAATAGKARDVREGGYLPGCHGLPPPRPKLHGVFYSRQEALHPTGRGMIRWSSVDSSVRKMIGRSKLQVVR